jgi:hypothetical protein
MATAAVEHKQELLEQAAEMQKRISVLQEQVQAFLRGAGALQVTLPELHDEATGRVDAQKVANYMGVPLARLAQALRLNYKALHRNPSAKAAQAALKPVKRSLEILHEFFQKSETVRVWLNTPHPDLDGHSALEMILVNNSNAVLRVLENAAAGVPV